MEPSEFKKSKKRTNISDSEKNLFWKVLKTLDEGKIYKIISEGVSTQQTRDDAWLRLTDVFNETAGKEMSVLQIRTMYSRIKEKIKKVYDQNVIDRQAADRQFNKDCNRTGGGSGSLPPENEDGDMIEDTMNDLQPAPAPFNSFTMGPPHYYRPLPSISGCSALSPPNHQITAAPSRPASSAPGGSGRGVSSAPPSRSPLFPPRGRASRLSSSPTPSITPPPPVSPVSREPRSSSLLLFSPIFSATSFSNRQAPPLLPQFSALGPPGSTVPSVSIPGPSQTARRPLTSVANVNSRTRNLDMIGDQHVQITDGAGNVTVAQAVDNGVTPTSSRTKKPIKKKDMNDEAVNYYSKMLEIQGDLALHRKRVLMRKERVEILKESLLKQAILKSGGELPDLGEMEEVYEDSSSDTGGEEDL